MENVIVLCIVMMKKIVVCIFFLNYCVMVCVCNIRMYDLKCYSVFYYINLKKEVFIFV